MDRRLPSAMHQFIPKVNFMKKFSLLFMVLSPAWALAQMTVAASPYQSKSFRSVAAPNSSYASSYNGSTNIRSQWVSQPASAPTNPSSYNQYYATGIASYYDLELAGRPTSVNETFNPYDLTAAHRFLPIGTMVKVVNKRNNKEVIVRINDRGPFNHENRIIDLSYGAANALDAISPGLIQVDLYLANNVDSYIRQIPQHFEAWTVQLASSQNQAFAEVAQRKLGPNAKVVVFQNPSGFTTYRLMYGFYNSKAEATNAKYMLQAQGYPNAFEKYLVDDHPEMSGLKK